MSVDSLLGDIGNPETRAALEDWATERGQSIATRVLMASGTLPSRDADADADADAYAATADANAYANAYADADDANAYATADADADAATAYAAGLNQQNISGGKHVKPGLYFWCQPSASVVVLRLGWVRRVEGDEYEALSMVTPQRQGDYLTMWADLAIDGPPKKWTFTRPMPRPSPLNRWHILGPVSLDPKQWSKICPKPEGWEESKK